MEAAIDSPCILVCTIDSATGYCRGCARTRDEIAAWMLMDDTAKAALIDVLATRWVSAKSSKPGASEAEAMDYGREN